MVEVDAGTEEDTELDDMVMAVVVDVVDVVAKEDAEE